MSRWAAVLNLTYFLLSAAPFQRPLRFHICYHRRQQPFAFLLRVCVDVPSALCSVGPGHSVSPVPASALGLTQVSAAPISLLPPFRLPSAPPHCAGWAVLAAVSMKNAPAGLICSPYKRQFSFSLSLIEGAYHFLAGARLMF